MPRVNSGNEGPAGGGVVGRLRTGHALDRPGAEPLRVSGDLLLDGVGAEGGDDRRRTGKDADEEPQHRAPQDRPEGILPVLKVGQEVPDLGGHDAPCDPLFEIDDDLGDAEESHDRRDQAHAVAEFEDAEGQPLGARNAVHADRADQQTEDAHHQGLEHGTRREVDEDHHAQEHQGEVFGRSECQGELGQGRGHEHQAQDGDRPGDEGAEGGDAQGGSRPPLPGHLVTVETGDHRGRLARDVDQDRRCRTSVHGPIVDPGQHDDRRDRGNVKGAGQEEGDGRRGSQAGQHADQRSHQDADEAEEQVRRREQDMGAQGNVIQQIHRSPGLLKNAHLPRCAADLIVRRIWLYVSLFGFLRALHLNIFEQPF